MTINIRLVHNDDITALQEFTVRAFEPIFQSWEGILGKTIFNHSFSDWREVHRNHVTNFFNDDAMHCYLAEIEGVPAGLVVYHLNQETKHGVIEFLVVHPDYQRQGIATALNQFALDQMRASGMEIAEVGTGGDDAHAPARRAYEKLGYIGLPAVYYYKDLTE